MTIQEADRIIWKYNLMCNLVCTCDRLGNSFGLCQRCTIEVSLTEEIVEEAYRVVEENNYKRRE